METTAKKVTVQNVSAQSIYWFGIRYLFNLILKLIFGFILLSISLFWSSVVHILFICFFSGLFIRSVVFLLIFGWHLIHLQLKLWHFLKNNFWSVLLYLISSDVRPTRNTNYRLFCVLFWYYFDGFLFVLGPHFEWVTFVRFLAESISIGFTSKTSAAV